MSKIKRFIPVFIVLVLIIYFTCQTPEETWQVSYGLQDFFMNLMPDAYGRWTTDMHWFRSLLHIPLYFLLGGFVQFSVMNFKKSVVICSIVAMADETLKIFLPTREFEVRDLVIDAMGFAVGIVIAAMICRLVVRVRQLRKVSC